MQVIDFGDIVLRSLPDGTCDSIEWDGKNWRHVQRVWRTDLSNAYYHNTTAKFAMANLNPTYGGLHNNPNYVMSNRFVIGSFEDMSNNIGISYINAVNSTYAFNFENEPGTNEHVREWLADNPTELIYKLSTPIETILEGIPSPQTFDNETWFGTPSALVKPYMMCECKVKKALKYQGEIIGQYYFGGNKSNETDRQITDISGNGNDLTPYNFAWTRESGWNQGGICSDGIDDYLIRNEELSIGNILITTSGFENRSGSIKYVLGFRSDNNNGGLCIMVNNRMGSANSYLISSPNNVLPEPLNYLLLTNNVSNYSSGISLFNFFGGTSYCSNGNLHEVILFGNYLTDSEYDNNLKVAKQRNGVDGDINIG